MPLSWNEIKDRALRFSREWAAEASEGAEAQSFWNGFFEVSGVSRRRVANFERRVKKIDGRDGYIDLLWKGVLLVEHKSRGKDLDRAFIPMGFMSPEDLSGDANLISGAATRFHFGVMQSTMHMAGVRNEFYRDCVECGTTERYFVNAT